MANNDELIQGDIIKGASGSYNASDYPVEFPFQSILLTSDQLRSRGWDPDWLGPECLLDGEARPTIPMIHTVGDMERAKAQKP